MNPENIWINSAIFLGVIAFAFLVIIFFMRLESKKENTEPSNVISFMNKYSLIFGVVFIIVGLALWIPILNGSESMFLFRPKRIGYDLPPYPELIPPGHVWNSTGKPTVPPYILILDYAFFNIRYFVFSFLGFLSLIIGLSFICAYVFRGIKKWIARSK